MLDNAPVALWLWNGIAELSPEQIKKAQQLLSPSENKYLGAIRAKTRRLEYIAGHHLIRQLLEHVAPHWAFDITIEHPKDEAPFLRGPNAERIKFNLSHSGNSVCCAMSLSCQLGLDIEQPRRRRKCLQIAEAYFSPAEAEQIANLPLAGQEVAFYSLWTLKESLLKAKHEDLSSDNLAIVFRREVAIPETSWHCYSFKIGHCYLALSLSKALHEPLSVHAYDFATGVSRVIQPQTNAFIPES